MPEDLIETDPDFMPPPLGDAWGPYSFGKPWDDGRPPVARDAEVDHGSWLICPEWDKPPEINKYVEHVEWVKTAYQRPVFRVVASNCSLLTWIPVLKALRNCPTLFEATTCADFAHPNVLDAMHNVLEFTIRSRKAMEFGFFQSVDEFRPRWSGVSIDRANLLSGGCLSRLGNLPFLEDFSLREASVYGKDLTTLIERLGGRLRKLGLGGVDAPGTDWATLLKHSTGLRSVTMIRQYYHEVAALATVKAPELKEVRLISVHVPSTLRVLAAMEASPELRVVLDGSVSLRELSDMEPLPSLRGSYLTAHVGETSTEVDAATAERALRRVLPNVGTVTSGWNLP